MGHAQGKLALSQHGLGCSHPFRPVHDKGDLCLHTACAAADIRFHSLLKGLEPLGRVVKVRDRLPELIRRIARQKSLEAAEGVSALVKVIGVLYLVVACGIFNEEVSPPVSPLGVHIEGFPISGPDKGQGLPIRIAASFCDGSAKIGGDALDIFHQGLGIFENLGVHPLEDVGPSADQAEGIIDMAASVGLTAYNLPLGVEGACGLHQNFTGNFFFHDLYSSHSFSG